MIKIIYSSNCNLIRQLAIIFGFIASIFVAVENFSLLLGFDYSYSTVLIVVMFLIGFLLQARSGLFILILCIPILPGADIQISSYLGFEFPFRDLVIFDLIAGYLLANIIKNYFYFASIPNHLRVKSFIIPWPINYVLLGVILSVGIAVMRNVWGSASEVSVSGLIHALLDFRVADFSGDLRPLTDLLAYILSFALASCVIRLSSFDAQGNAYIFRAVSLGLFVSVLMAILQSQTGIGLRDIIKDSWGYAALGFFPDLHSFAGYMLLGAVGLWGYFIYCKSWIDRILICFTSLFSWIGLLLSLSRATLGLAILVSLAFFLFLVARHVKKLSLLKFWAVVTVFILIIFELFYYYGVEFLTAISRRNLELINKISTSNLLNFVELNAAFSERPVLYLNAYRMWSSFPLLGVGQSNFYHLFPMFNVEHIGNSFVINGENTHNYFLQTLAETGLVGVLGFTLAILAPFFLVKDRRALIPAAVALFSLFLGNIFAHSFLVRENLFLAAVFVGLMYSYVPAERLALSPLQLLKEWKPKIPWNWVVPSAVFVVLVLGAREVYTSFHKFPFQYGSNCWINRPVGPDGWTSGLYEVLLPVGSHGLRIPLKVMRPNLGEKPLGAGFSLVDSKGRVLATQAIEWKENGPNTIEIALPNGGVIQDAGVRASLKLSSCYTPRNLGESADGRRLGVMVDSPIIY